MTVGKLQRLTDKFPSVGFIQIYGQPEYSPSTIIKKTCSEDSENDEERQQRLYSKLKIKSVCLEAFIDE